MRVFPKKVKPQWRFLTETINMNQNILIASAGQRVSLVKAFQKEVKKLKDTNKVYTVDLNPILAPACHVSDGYRTVKRVTDSNYISELIQICKELEISKYFKTIEGSPTPKNDLVKNILQKYSYNPKECILIGDSINDYEAANINGIKFYGYNNEELRSLDEYIEDSKDFLI